MDTHSKSQFTRDFNLTKVLFLILHLTELTFQDSSDYEIVREFNYRHGEFYLYKFNVDRIIGYSIEAEQFTKHIGIFFVPLPSRAISLARGHLRVSSFARRTTKKTETARSQGLFI